MIIYENHIAGYSFGVGSTIKPLTLGGVIKFLTTDRYRKQIDELNDHRANFGKDEAYRKLKEALPSLAFGGWFKDGVRKQSEVERMSGFLLIDIDSGANEDINHDEMLEWLRQFKEHPSTFYADLSSSGKGIHCLFRIPVVKEDISEYFKHAFKVIARDFREDCGISIDTAVSGIQSLKFLGYGIDPFINIDAVEYNIPEYTPVIREKSDTDKSDSLDRAKAFLNSLLENGLFYEDSEKVMYSEAPERHTWIVKAATLLFKNFQLEQEDYHTLLLPLAKHEVSTSGKDRIITESEIRSIISWCVHVEWTDTEEEETPNQEEEAVDLPYNDTTYKF